MKYFLHSSTSFSDEKITELYINYGYEGLGLFYTILEKLALQEQPMKTDVLKHQLKVGKRLNKCWEFMEKIDLISSNNGETFNKHLLKFSEKYKIKKEKNAKRISEWRKNQEDKENETRYESVRNNYKVNKSKVKEREVNNYKKTLLSEINISDFPQLDDKILEIAKSFQLLFINNLKEKGIKIASAENADGTWYDDIRLMIENDKYCEEDFREMFRFLQKDDFWKKQIRSTAKLRKQAETLLINYRSSDKKNKATDEMDAFKQEIINNLNNFDNE